MAREFAGRAPRRSIRPAARVGAAVRLLALAVGAGGLAWDRLGARPGVATTAPRSSVMAAAAGDSVRAPAVTPATFAAPQAAPDGGDPPEGMTRAQWTSLRQQLAGQPHADAEIARVTDTMAYLSRLARYRALRGGGADALPEARGLAAGLLDRLPAHVAQNEMSLGEARRLQDALFDTLATADAARAAERDRLQAAAPAPSGIAAQAEQNARFEREAAGVLAAWKTQAPAQRDARQLESALEALRRSVFSPAEAPSAHPSTGVPK